MKFENLKFFPDYKAIPQSKSFCCESCDGSKSQFLHDPTTWREKHQCANFIGYTDAADLGWMVVCECPVCFDKFRHHINTTERYDKEKFLQDLEAYFL